MGEPASIEASAATAVPDHSARGLRGHLHVTCALDLMGRSHLRAQSFRAPMHISKPYLDAGMLVLNVVNPTAGLLAGDEITCEVAVERGAQLLLTTPSASRAHRMRESSARLTQRFTVEEGAFLEVWPEPLIPQAGTRYLQRTVAHVEKGGTLLLAEMLAPGRVASGEVFAYEWLRWETDIFNAGALTARERYILSPGTASVRALQEQFPEAYYASVYILSPALAEDSPCWQSIHELHTPAGWVGVSRLQAGGWVVKVLADRSIALRSLVSAIHRLLYASLGRSEPNLRRAGRV